MANRELLIKIAADSSQAVSALKNIDQATGKTAGQMGKLDKAVKGAIAAFGARELLQFAKGAVDAAAQLEDSMGAVESVFGTAAGQVFEFTEQAAQLVGLSKGEANQAMAELGNSLQNAGMSASEAADQSKELLIVAADMSALMGTTVPEALTAVQAALRGEFDPIEKFTGGMSAAIVKAKALEMGLITGSGEMDNQAKVAATLAVIMERSGRATGQFARESDGAAGQTKTTRAEMQDMQAEIGQRLLPAYLDLLGAVKDAAPALADFAGEVADVTSDLGPLLSVVGGMIGKFGEFRAAIDELADSDGFAGVLGDNIKSLTNPLGGLADAIDAVKTEFGLNDDEAVNYATTLSGMPGPIGTTVGWQEKLENQSRETAGEILSVKDALLEQAAALDPLQRLISTFGKVEAAQEAFTEAVEKHGPTSKEAADAAVDLAIAQLDLESAAQSYKESGGTALFGVLEDTLKTLGLTDEQIRKVIESLGLLDSAAKKVGGLPTSGSGGYTQVLDSGGIVAGPKGAPRLVLAHGGETVLPTHKQPLESFMTGSGGVSSSGSVVNQYITTYDPATLALFTREAVERARRS